MTKHSDSLSRDERDRPNLTAGLLEGFDGVLCHIDQLIECGNKWASKIRRTDRENYLDRDIKFLFEHEVRGRDNFPKGLTWDVSEWPAKIATVTAERYLPDETGGVGKLLPEHASGHASVVCRWGQRPVLVGDVELIDEIEQAVPSRLTVGFERDDCVEEANTYPLGESVCYGFLKPCRSFAEGELDGLERPLAFHVGGDDVPPGMIESGADVVSGIASDNAGAIYDGFVFFGVGGALAGYCVCFDDITKGAFFAEQFTKFRDAFRSPLKF
ncbi:hypothetical protein A3748_13340 [Erythrobacter sp. HI0077]|nr:hypothetical protein A3745_11650 [Erythrobacter sp. HI0074]KZZ07847.1 hypothetical protein A3748_13340 [Erythrobacter sp. HI0077]